MRSVDTPYVYPPRAWRARRPLKNPARADHLYFFFSNTPTTEIYTLSLHDALPISLSTMFAPALAKPRAMASPMPLVEPVTRSEEHTSELQSPDHLVCRLLLEK